MKKIGWRAKLAIGLIIAAIILYGLAYYLFNDAGKVMFHVVIDLAFVPIDILIVVLVIESLIEKKERETILDKLDMILGIFFSEIGNNLLELFSKVNRDNGEIVKKIHHVDEWDKKDFKNAYKKLKENGIDFNPDIEEGEIESYLINLKTFLQGKRGFLIELIENPNIIEKDSFSNLLLSIFHLDDELELRSDLDKVTKKDFEHLIGDINRVYCRLTYEWIKYLEFLNEHYPYMSSITIRANPFNPEDNIYITD